MSLAPQNRSRGSCFCPFVAACWPLPACLSCSLRRRPSPRAVRRPCRSASPRRSPSGSRSGTNISGRFEAVASVEVRARVSGFIEKLHFKDGQLVNAGDPLFTIDKRPYEIAVESAKAEVARNKAQVDLAELQVQRGASLVASRTITDAENDQRKANLAVAKAQLKAAEAGLAHRRAQPRMDRRARADRRPHLRPQGRCRQPDPGRPAGRHPARHHRHARSHPLRVRRLGVRLPALHAPLPVGRAGLVARDAIPVRIRLADETEWTRTGKVDFVDNTFEPALRHHPHPRHRRQQGPAADARHVRPRPALWRRVRCAADPRFGGGLRPGAQDRVHGRRRQRGRRPSR